MRTLLLAATALAVAVPAGLSAQPTAEEANVKGRQAPPPMTVTPNPGSPATVTHRAQAPMSPIAVAMPESGQTR